MLWLWFLFVFHCTVNTSRLEFFGAKFYRGILLLNFSVSGSFHNVFRITIVHCSVALRWLHLIHLVIFQWTNKRTEPGGWGSRNAYHRASIYARWNWESIANKLQSPQYYWTVVIMNTLLKQNFQFQENSAISCPGKFGPEKYPIYLHLPYIGPTSTKFEIQIKTAV